MASGCACVLPRQGGGTDFSAHFENALHFEGGNIEDLYEKVRLLLDFPVFRAEIQTRAAQVPRRLTIDRSAAAFIDLIENPDQIPEIPDMDSAFYFRARLAVLEEAAAASKRKEAHIFYLGNELEKTRERFRYFMNECYSQKLYIAELEEKVRKTGCGNE
jgi:hypothetical protein